MTAPIIAALALILAAGVTAAGSVIVAIVSKRREAKADTRDDLLVATLGRLDSSMLLLAKSIGALEADAAGVRADLEAAKAVARKDLEAATQEVVEVLREHTEQDHRGWRFLGVPENVLSA